MKANWTDSLNEDKTDELVFQLSSELSKRIVGIHRARIDRDIVSRDRRSLADFPIDYSQVSLSDARYLRQIRAFFEKRSDIDFGIDRRAVALETFSKTEESCRLTNDIFRKVRRGSFSFEPRVSSVLFYATRKIASILGDVPKLSDLKFRFGPGAVIGTTKKNAAPRVKLGMRFSCSGDLAPYVDAVLGECPGWIPFTDEDSCIVPVDVAVGKVTTVPKSWKTDRTICVEPLLNSFVQLGIGDYISDRLLRFGQDIRDSERNRKAALKGSLSGGLATLDLSSASDTIATELVRDLLPLPWFESLSACRTSRVVLNDEVIDLQKFSTMGNGFTFPLETLLFYGIAYGATKIVKPEAIPEIEVYGDDIIVATEVAPLMQKVLECVGFTVNADKSFTSGPFRESCGADYYTGIDIRPVYLKDGLSFPSLFRLHNAFRRRLEEELADIVLSYIPEPLRIFGPDGYGDGHLLPKFGEDPPLKRFGASKGWGGYTFDTYVLRGRRLTKLTMPGDRYLPVYSIYISDGVVGSSGNNHTYNKEGCLSVPLPGTRGYKRISIYTLGI